MKHLGCAAVGPYVIALLQSEASAKTIKSTIQEVRDDEKKATRVICAHARLQKAF